MADPTDRPVNPSAGHIFGDGLVSSGLGSCINGTALDFTGRAPDDSNADAD